MFWLGSSWTTGAAGGTADGVLLPWAEVVIRRTACSGALGVAGFCWLRGRERGRLNASEVGGRIMSENRKVLL